MKQNEAEQIAMLLNRRNKLSKKFTGESISDKQAEYLFLKDKETVIACVQCKKVQWYQFEICHLSVHEDFEGEGLGFKILQLAEDEIRKKEGKVIQCTIRDSNERSIKLFTQNGYKEVNKFFNPRTENTVNIYQKVMSVE